MRKSFTQLFGFLLLSVMLLFSSGLNAQEVQETVEVYAETVPTACYNVSNSYAAKISVKDFIAIKNFKLTLKYDASVFTAGAATTIGAGSVLAGIVPTVTEVGSVGTVTITWSNAVAQTIGDNVITNIISVPFSVDGFPNNSPTNSFTSALTWDEGNTMFYYDEPGTVPVLNVNRATGSIGVSVTYASLSPSDYSLGTIGCNAGNTTLTILNPAAAAGMEYQFNGGTWQTSASSSVLAGANTVRFRNNTSGCLSHVFTINVSEPSALVVNPVSVTDALCATGNGEVVFNYSGGTNPYVFYAVPSTSYAALLSSVTTEYAAAVLGDYDYTNSVISLPAGTYRVAATSNGCQMLFQNVAGWTWSGQWEEITIAAPPALVTPVIAGFVNNTCPGGTTGSIDVDDTALGGGTPPYTVSINGTTWVTATAGIEFSGLAKGTYTIRVKDANNCIATTTQAVGGPDALAFTLAYKDVTCVSVTKGKIWIASASGGSGTYEYLVKAAGVLPVGGDTWQAVTGFVEANAAYTTLDPTYYSIYLRDASNPACAYVSFANQDGTGNVLPIQTPGQLAFTTNIESGIDVTCNGDDKTITITPTGGSGVYTVTVDGFATTKIGNTYNYTLNDLLVNQDVLIVVTDNLACSINRLVTVNVAPAMTINASSIIPPSCPGGADGIVTVLATGSVAPYEYSVDNIYWQSQNDITITEAATTIWARSASSPACKISMVVDVANLTPNTLTETHTNVICNGLSTGSFTVTSSWLAGRIITYYYSTDASKVGTTNTAPGSGVTLLASGLSDVTPNATKVGLPAGTYYVWVVDDFGCMKSLASPVVISQNAALSMTAVKTLDATCYMKQDGLITITATAGSNAAIAAGVYHQYAVTQNFPSPSAPLVWKNFDSVVLAPTTLVPTSTQLISAAKGSYYIFVKDESCVSTNIVWTKVDVGGYDNITTTANPVVITAITCNGNHDGIIQLSPSKVSGGKPGYDGNTSLYSFTLSGGGLVSPVTNGTGLFTGLYPGTYTMVLTDAMSCNPITFSNLVVSQPGVLTVTSTIIQHFTCTGSNDGIIRFNISGGTAPYKFAVNNSANGTGNDITEGNWISMTGNTKDYVATETGDFTVYVKDAVGICSAAKSNVVNIKQPTPLTLTQSSTPVTCNGGSNGTITVNVTGGGWLAIGAQTYSFRLENNGVLVTTNGTGVFSGLAAGANYVVKVTTVTSPAAEYPLINCGASISTPVTQPNPWKYQTTVTNVQCKGEANGTLKVKVLDGGIISPTVGYQVALVTTLSPTAVWVNTYTGVGDADPYAHTFTGLPHAIYTVLVRNANGTCEMAVGSDEPDNAEFIYFSQESFEVNEPAVALTASVTWNNDITCYDGSNGKFTVTANGGTGPYLYAAKLSQLPAHILLASELVASDWKDNSGVFDTAHLGTGALDGTFIIWVKDANGCIVGGEGNGIPVDQWRVQVTQPAEVAFTSSTNSNYGSEVICYGASTGTVTATVTNAGVVTGTGYPYTIRVQGTSAGGVAINEVRTITSGALTVTGLPATETYHVEPIGGHTHNAYTVTVTNKNGCLKTGSIVVWQRTEIVVAPLTITAGFKCFGDNNGFIETSATGGSGSYLYQLWRDGASFSGWVNISAFAVEVGHTYFVKVKDANGSVITPCEKVSNTIDIVAPVVVEAEIKDITCFEAPSASARLFVSQGNLNRTYTVQYQVVTGVVAGVEQFGPMLPSPSTSLALDPQTNSVQISNLSYANNNAADQGYYYFYITDDKGCTAEKVKHSFVPTQQPMALTVVQDDISAVVSITGGISSEGIYTYSYQVGSGAVVPVTGNSFPLGAADLMAGANVITVYDAHECVKTVTINVDPISVSVDPIDGDNMENEFDVVLTFNRAVTIAEGDVTGGTVVPGTATEFTVAMAGADGDELELVLANTIVDASGNTFDGATYSYTVGDNKAPTVVVTPPATIPTTAVYTVGLAFDEEVTGVEIGTGIIVTGATAVVDASVGNTYTITVTAPQLTNVTIMLTSAITDVSTNSNPIAEQTLSYMSGDFTPPTIVSMTPTPGSVLPNAHPTTFEVVVDETVVKGTGKLTVYKKSDNSAAIALDASTAVITAVGSASKVVVPIPSTLDQNTEYYILIDEGFVADASGNDMPALVSKTVWTFTTTNFATAVTPKSASLKVYPNPFVNDVNLVSSVKLSKVIVTNIAGQTVKTIVNPSNVIKLSELRSGIYFMSMYNNDEVIINTTKIVKR